MEREAFEIKHSNINVINDISLLIKNKEYNDIRIEDNCVYALCQDLIMPYNLYINEQQERFYDNMVNNPFIDGIHARRLYHNVTYDVYKELLSEAIESAQKSARNYSPRYYLCPFHIIRQSEVEKFYEYTSSIVIKGIEVKRFFDAGQNRVELQLDNEMPNYIAIYDRQILIQIPSNDIMHVEKGHDRDIGRVCYDLIPKKYIDKIILRRKYLHTDLIEFCLEKFYTGEEDVFELDPKNPDPKVLEMMKEYRVIIESES